jgi:hypothetical protein
MTMAITMTRIQPALLEPITTVALNSATSLPGQSSIDGTTVTHFCERNEIFTGKQNHYFRTEANDLDA